MANTSTAQIKLRIEALTALVPGITTVLSGAEERIDPSLLPAVEVRVGRRFVRRKSKDIYVSIRVFELWIFAYEVTQPENDAQAEFGLDDVIPLNDALVDFFVLRERLQLEGGDNGVVENVPEIEDMGRGKTPYKGGYYAAGRVRLTTEQERYVEEEYD